MCARIACCLLYHVVHIPGRIFVLRLFVCCSLFFCFFSPLFLFFLSFYQHYVLRVCVCVCVNGSNGGRSIVTTRSLAACLFPRSVYFYTHLSLFFFSGCRCSALVCSGRFDDAWCFSLHGFFCHSIQSFFFFHSFFSFFFSLRSRSELHFLGIFIAWQCVRVCA